MPAGVFVLTSSGIFNPDANDKTYLCLPWTTNEAWDLQAIGSDEYLFAESYALLHIAGDSITAITNTDTYPRVIKLSQKNPGIIYLGTEHGIVVLSHKEGVFTELYRNQNMENLSILTIDEMSPTTIWVGSERGGIQELVFNAGMTEMSSRETLIYCEIMA
jgi:ligand-binding sensor domain-containing protein